MTSKCYGIIFESKMEPPIIREGQPMSYQDAREMAHKMALSPTVIRVAVVKLTYAMWGNETIVEQEEDF